MMTYLTRLIAIALVSILPVPVQAGGGGNGLTIAVPLVPPYFDRSGNGIEASRIRGALSSAYCPDDVRFVVRSFVRHWQLYATDSSIDAVATVPKGETLPGHPSEFYITYQNGIGYRKSAFPDGIKNISDPSLDGKRIAAFVDALGILPGLSAKRPLFSSYVENGNQKTNSILLEQNKVDAVLSDRRIFDFYNRQIDGLKDAEIGFDAIFPPSPYRMKFRSREVRDVFNAGLKRTDGENSQIPARCN